MKMNKYLIAGGNPTLLVEGCPVSKKQKLVVKYLGKDIDQIGFINYGNPPKLGMMGNELCVNATLAFASTLNNKRQLITSGISQGIYYFNDNEITTLLLPSNFSIPQSNIVLLQGIGFYITKSKDNVDLKQLCKKYKLPAFGKITFRGNKIAPTIYVDKTNSTINESACGSGSIAFSIFSSENDIIQPTGESINVDRVGNFFKISAKVIKID